MVVKVHMYGGHIFKHSVSKAVGIGKYLGLRALHLFEDPFDIIFILTDD